MDIKLLRFRQNTDPRGSLVALEAGSDIPFEIKRVFFIYNADEDAVRGSHAHGKMQEVIICLRGSCALTVDDGRKRQTFTLDRSDEGIYLSANIWREIHDFSPDALLLALASEHYDPYDYIRDYSEFLKAVT